MLKLVLIDAENAFLHCFEFQFELLNFKVIFNHKTEKRSKVLPFNFYKNMIDQRNQKKMNLNLIK